MLKLYGHELSGNTYKVRLLLDLSGIDYEHVRVDLMAGEHKQPEYLALNPFGQVPIVVDGDRVVRDAQAILVYVAGLYAQTWSSDDPIEFSEIVRWLSTAAGEVRQGPENARLYHLFGAKSINIDRAVEKAQFILAQLDTYLADRDWLALDRPTIADLAVFPYVALAPDGRVLLDAYPQVLAWIDRVSQLPGFVAMKGIETLAAA